MYRMSRYCRHYSPTITLNSIFFKIFDKFESHALKKLISKSKYVKEIEGIYRLSQFPYFWVYYVYRYVNI